MPVMSSRKVTASPPRSSLGGHGTCQSGTSGLRRPTALALTVRKPISFSPAAMLANAEALSSCIAVVQARHLPPRFDEERIGGFVVGPFGELGFGQGAFEVMVQFLAPG